MSVSVRVPGKLFLTGEYAVLTAGSPAVIIAVDRYVTVRVDQCDSKTAADVVVESDLYSPVSFLWDKTHLVDCSSQGLDSARQYRLVRVALHNIAQFITDHGKPVPRKIRLRITSDLHSDGQKFGLGSSGAVIVAIIEAISRYCDVPLDADTRFRIAFLTVLSLSPTSSGGDVAASSFGGWIEYRCPDQRLLADLMTTAGLTSAVEASWPAYTIRPLTPCKDLCLAVGWTGFAVSTETMVNQSDRSEWSQSLSYAQFLGRMNHCTERLISELAYMNGQAACKSVNHAGRILADFDQQVDIGIFTDQLRALCTIAQDLGWASKPSGAGGGDCGIALRFQATEVDLAELVRGWQQAGVQYLPIDTGYMYEDSMSL